MHISCILGLYIYNIEFLQNHVGFFWIKGVRGITLSFEEYSVLRIGLKKGFMFNSEDYSHRDKDTSSIIKLKVQNKKCD